MACPFYGQCQQALMLGAGARLPPGVNLASVGNKPLQLLGVFIIDDLDFVFAKDTDLTPGSVPGFDPLLTPDFRSS